MSPREGPEGVLWTNPWVWGLSTQGAATGELLVKYPKFWHQGQICYMCWSLSWLMVPIARVVCAVVLDWEQWLVTSCGAAIQRDPESVLWKSWGRAGTTGSASLLFWGRGFPSNLFGYTERIKYIPPYSTKVGKKRPRELYRSFDGPASFAFPPSPYQVIQMSHVATSLVMF